jgi:TfoX/Sxy family transcriptional regulator of competence genes
MAYDEKLAERVRRVLAGHDGLSERKMFGGTAFMLRGHMCCGVMGDDLVVRVGADQHEAALSEPHARHMDFTGRPMRGMVYVGPGGYETDEALLEWITRGVEFVASLPAKQRNYVSSGMEVDNGRPRR